MPNRHHHSYDTTEINPVWFHFMEGAQTFDLVTVNKVTPQRVEILKYHFYLN